MKTAKTMMSLLLLSAVCVSPASANWFSNPRTGTMLNIGSAPNPTPADLRRIGDSQFSTRTGFAASQEQFVEPVEYQVDTDADLTDLEGKTVFSAHGARLGWILTVNHAERLAAVQTPGGIALAMPVGLLMDNGNRVVAPTISPLDMMAMAKTQTGRTVAINVDRRHMPIRASRG